MNDTTQAERVSPTKVLDQFAEWMRLQAKWPVRDRCLIQSKLAELVIGAWPMVDAAQPAERRLAKCGHPAYRDHDNLCLQDGCPYAAYATLNGPDPVIATAVPTPPAEPPAAGEELPTGPGVWIRQNDAGIEGAECQQHNGKLWYSWGPRRSLHPVDTLPSGGWRQLRTAPDTEREASPAVAKAMQTYRRGRELVEKNASLTARLATVTSKLAEAEGRVERLQRHFDETIADLNKISTSICGYPTAHENGLDATTVIGSKIRELVAANAKLRAAIGDMRWADIETALAERTVQ